MKYLDGIDSRVDYKLAYELFSQVAEKDNNNTEAKLLLAKMYENGFYVDKSYSKAFELYHDAYEKGSPAAMYMLGYYAENRFYDINTSKIQKKYVDGTKKQAVIFSVSAMDKIERQRELVEKLCGIGDVLSGSEPAIQGISHPNACCPRIPHGCCCRPR